MQLLIALFLGCKHTGYSSDFRIFGLASSGHRFVQTTNDSLRVTPLSLSRHVEALSTDTRLAVFLGIVNDLFLNQFLLKKHNMNLLERRLT